MSSPRPPLWRRLLGRPGAVAADALDPARPDLVVVVSGWDDAEAASAAIERGRRTPPHLDTARPVLMRHHLVLPAEQVAAAVDGARHEGYTAGPVPEKPVGRLGEQAVCLQRVELLDALHCSQQRSRMAGLAQRLGGRALGWEGLQPPS